MSDISIIVVETIFMKINGMQWKALKDIWFAAQTRSNILLHAKGLHDVTSDAPCFDRPLVQF